MDPFKLLLTVGLTSFAAACSSDSNPNNGADAGDTGGKSATGGSGASSGGKSTTGGSAGKGSGGSEAGSGGTAPGAGGAGAGGGQSAGGSAGKAGSTSTGGGAGSGAGGGASGGTPGDAGPDAAPVGAPVEHVFVIAMENHDESQIIGDMTDAPYINGTLLKGYASTSNFVDTLPLNIPSEPHYVLVESGTNAFSDVTFTTDDDPSAANSTSSTEHLVAQMKTASVSWMSYQEGLEAATTGACPIHTYNFYGAKHDPFVFFQDVAGSPPSDTNAYCVAHHAPSTQLAGDLSGDKVAAYTFITPNLCNDMHGAGGCPNSNTIRSGDDWLKANVPGLITYANAHNGVIFILWDEGYSTLQIPFIAVGPMVKRNYVSSVEFNHGSVVKTVEKIFSLPTLAKVASSNDLSDLFLPGSIP